MQITNLIAIKLVYKTILCGGKQIAIVLYRIKLAVNYSKYQN